MRAGSKALPAEGDAEGDAEAPVVEVLGRHEADAFGWKCVAIWLANDQRETWRKWASVFGLAGQPFWFYSAFAAEQWGILALTFVYTASWARGFRNNWMRSNA